MTIPDSVFTQNFEKSFNPREKIESRGFRENEENFHAGSCFLLLWVIISKSSGKRGARCSEFARLFHTHTKATS